MFDTLCRNHPVLASCLLAFLISISILVSKAFSFDIPPLLLSTMRTGLLAPLLLIVPHPRNKPYWTSLMMGGLLAYGYYGSFYTALSLGAMPGASVLFAQLLIPFSLFMAIPYLGLWPSCQQALGTGLILLGSFGISYALGLHVGNSSVMYYLLLSIVSLGMWQLFSKKHTHKDHYAHMIWQCAFGALLTLILSWLSEGYEAIVATVISLSFKHWFGLGLLSYGGTLLTGVMISKLLSYHAPGKIMPLIAITPCFVLAESYLVFGETLTFFQQLSALIIIVGAIISQALAPTKRA